MLIPYNLYQDAMVNIHCRGLPTYSLQQHAVRSSQRCAGCCGGSGTPERFDSVLHTEDDIRQRYTVWTIQSDGDRRDAVVQTIQIPASCRDTVVWTIQMSASGRDIWLFALQCA